MKKRSVAVTGRFYHRQTTLRNTTNLLHPPRLAPNCSTPRRNAQNHHRQGLVSA